MGSVLRRVRLLRTESHLAQVSVSWQGQFHSESPTAVAWGVNGSRGEGPSKGSWLVLEVWLLSEQLFCAGYLRIPPHDSPAVGGCCPSGSRDGPRDRRG